MLRIPLLSMSLVALATAVMFAQPLSGSGMTLPQAVREASLLSNSKSFTEALDLLETAIATSKPGDYSADALLLLAECSTDARQYDRALSSCREFLRQFPEDRRRGRLIYLRGVSSHQSGRYADAES